MRFIYPDFLWALFFIAVPVIIHLVNLRRHRTVYFSNVSLLKKVKRDNRKKSKLKQLLILSSRILMITALVLAFAKPYFPSGDNIEKVQKHVSGIYIDNSFSMNAKGPEGKAIESARQKAMAIVNGSKPDTKYTLLTNNLQQQHNRFYNKSEIMQLIADVEVTHNTLPMSTVQLRMQNLMDDLLLETRKNLFFISDFQKHTSDIENFTPDTTLAYNFIPVPVNKAPNLYVDTCWFESPTHHLKQSEKLHVVITNNSEEDYYKVPVNFFINDSLEALASIDIEAGSEQEVILEYINNSTGYQEARIEITDYPIVYDNKLYLSYQVKESLDVLLIEQNNTNASNNIRALFQNDSYINLETARTERLQISTLGSFSTIILNEPGQISTGLSDELTKFVANGGTLAIVPGQNIESANYNTLLGKLNTPTISTADTVEVPIGDINYSHELYNDVFNSDDENVDMPDIQYRYRFKKTARDNGSQILTFADNSQALTLYPYQNGKVFMFAFPFSHPDNNFVNHILFLPTVYNIALQSSFMQNLYYVIGKDQTFSINTTANLKSGMLTLQHAETKDEVIPAMRQQSGREIRLAVPGELEAGNYLVTALSENIGITSFNYELNESDFNYYSNDELEDESNKAGLPNSVIVDVAGSDLSTTIKQIDNGKQLWKWFIIAAIIFFLVEAAIIRFWP
ncbi:MAG: BatA domain-containing protein [Prolixibacteraceae bacterium]|nr:BatA domain-containing protein [Prolixibacteraceae bacterium]